MPATIGEGAVCIHGAAEQVASWVADMPGAIEEAKSARAAKVQNEVGFFAATGAGAGSGAEGFIEAGALRRSACDE